jgi:hypothetical protein
VLANDLLVAFDLLQQVQRVSSAAGGTAGSRLTVGVRRPLDLEITA